MTLLLLAAIPNPARADCPVAPLADPDDMAISFLAANGVQAASASLLASSVKEGTLIYDDTADKLKICNGTNWIDVGSGSGTDTLASLSCSTGQIAKFNGTAWACAADGGGGSGVEVAFSANKNGSTIAQTLGHASNGGGFNTPVSAVVSANGTTDYFDAVVYQGTGSAQTIDGSNTNTYFSGSVLGGGADTLSGLSCSSGQIAKYNGTAWACAADGGGGAGTSAPGPYLRLGYSANALDRMNVIPFTVSESGGGATWASNKFTAVTPGLYMVSVNGYALGQYHLIFTIRKNGAGITTSYGDAAQAAKHGGASATTVTYLNAGDYIDFYYSHDTPGIYLNTATASVAYVGGGGSGNTVAFRAHKNNVDQTVTASTPTKLTFSTEGFDTNNNFNTTTSQFTPTVAGKYLISVKLMCSNSNPACSAYIYKNGALHAQSYTHSNNDTAAQLVQLVDMNGTTDYVEAWGFVGSGTTVSGTVGNTEFSGFLIGGGGSDTLAGLSCATNEIPKWNGSAWACAVDGGGGGTEYSASITRGSNQSIPNATWTTLTWTAEAIRQWQHGRYRHIRVPHHDPGRRRGPVHRHCAGRISSQRIERTVDTAQ